MARIQYQAAARAGGYRPQQVDERNIARMREETARQIEGMRQAANAEIESRREIARAMKEDAAYTKSAKEKNYQIQTANSNRQIQGLQAQAARDQQQFNADAKATESIFKSIASFSESAGKIVNQIQEAQEQTTTNEQRLDLAKNGLSFQEQLDRELQEKVLNITSVNVNSAVDLNNAKGGDRLAGAKIREADPGTNYRANKVQLNYIVGEYRKRELQKHLQSLREQGNLNTLEDQYKAVSDFNDAFYNLDVFKGVDPKIYAGALQKANEYDRTLFAAARRDDEQHRNNSLSEKLISTIQFSSAEDLNQNVLTSFPILNSIHNSPKVALDKIQAALNTQKADGSFRFTVDEAENVQFIYNGKPVTLREKWPNRAFELRQERLRIDNQRRQQQIQADKLAHAELEDTLARAVLENPTVERLEEAKQMYLATALKESPKLAVIEKSLTYTAQHKQNIVSAATKLRDFELTPEIVAAAVAANPTKGRAIKERYEAYNAKWKSEGYKDATKSLETVVSGTTSFGTTKAAEAGALPMIANLKAELRKRTAIYEPALGFEAAHQKAAGELANEYRNGYRNKDSKFYRKVSRNGTVSYPNLPVGNVSAAEQVKRDVNDLRTSVKTIGVEGVLDTPLSVTSAERLDYIKKNFYKDDFKPTPKELAFIGMSKGMPLHEAYNRFFQANGDSFRLNSPLRLNGKEVTLTPEDQKILGDPTKGPQAKLSVINRILNPEMFQTAQSMRAGSPFLVYTAGNIGPTSTGPHLDVKQVGGAQFAPTALDSYIEVDDPELGVVPLSRVPITGDFASHTARGSHGIDYGLYTGTKIYAKNGARVISNTPTEHGDKLLIQLPDGKQYTFLHGTAAK